MKYFRLGSTSVLPALLTILFFFVLWEVAVWVWEFEEWLLPSPTTILKTFTGTYHLLPEHVWITTKAAVIGFLLGIAVGLILAFILNISPFLRKSFYPLLLFSQTIPIIAIAPLLIIWFGYGLLPKILLVALVTFFPIVVSTLEGLQSSDRDMIRLVRSMGCTYFQEFRLVRFPSALPYLFTGLRIGATYSVLAAVISEWVGASKGLGIFLIRSQNSFSTDKVFVAIAMISLLSCFIFLIVILIEKLVMPWKFKKYKK